MIESYPDYQRNMMENHPDYSSEEYLDSWGWHEDQVVAVPGFGFFPSIMKEELEEEAQVLLINFTFVSTFSLSHIFVNLQTFNMDFCRTS